VLVALRGAASGALSAALRLGAISAHSAQRMLSQLHPSSVRACGRAIEAPLADLHSSAPELEILALAHPRGDARSFTT
jgi:urease accessory protein